MATRLFAFPAALASAVQRVSFPALSRSAQDRPQRAAQAAALSAVLASLPLALLAGSSHTLVEVLLGDRWLETVDVVLTSSPGVLLAASAIPAMVGLALSQGRPGGPIAAVIGSAIVMAAVSLAAVPDLGAAGVGIATTVSAVVNAAMLALHTEREMRAAVAPVIRALAIGALAAGLGYLAPLPEDWLGLLARLGLVTAVWSSLGLWLMRSDLRAALRIARPMVPPRLRSLAWRP
jgi:PST family polysaccharide transporter